MDEVGSVEKVSLSLKRLRGGVLGGAPSLGTLEDTLRKNRIRASLSMGAPLSPEERGRWGTLYRRL